MTADFALNVPAAVTISVALLVVGFVVLVRSVRPHDVRPRRFHRTRVGVFLERELDDVVDATAGHELEDTLELPPR